MFGLLDRLARRLVKDIDRLLIEEPSIEDSDFEGVNPTVWITGNEAAMDRLDAKAGSILTHISMMIAAATFMISSVDSSSVERVIIGVEIVAYLFFALICIRCLGFVEIPSGQPSGLGQINEAVRIEVRRRSLLLNLAVRWMFFLTFVFMLTVMTHIFL